ncbi:MAG: proteasome activator [Acidimicrobiales bacterium]
MTDRVPEPVAEQESDATDGDGAGPLTPELLERPEVLEAGDGPDDDLDETVDHPAKVMRIGTMMKQLLEEVRVATLDEPSRDRLREIYDTSISELGSALSPDLRGELNRLALPFSDGEVPSAAELQIAKAQLVGWLEGLVQGMQAMLFAQQMAAQQQLQSMRAELGPPGADGRPAPDERPGTYL